MTVRQKYHRNNNNPKVLKDFSTKKLLDEDILVCRRLNLNFKLYSHLYFDLEKDLKFELQLRFEAERLEKLNIF